MHPREHHNILCGLRSFTFKSRLHHNALITNNNVFIWKSPLKLRSIFAKPMRLIANCEVAKGGSKATTSTCNVVRFLWLALSTAPARTSWSARRVSIEHFELACFHLSFDAVDRWTSAHTHTHTHELVIHKCEILFTTSRRDLSGEWHWISYTICSYIFLLLYWPTLRRYGYMFGRLRNLYRLFF